MHIPCPFRECSGEINKAMCSTSDGRGRNVEGKRPKVAEVKDEEKQQPPGAETMDEGQEDQPEAQEAAQEHAPEEEHVEVRADDAPEEEIKVNKPLNRNSNQARENSSDTSTAVHQRPVRSTRNQNPLYVDAICRTSPAPVSDAICRPWSASRDEIFNLNKQINQFSTLIIG